MIHHHNKKNPLWLIETLEHDDKQAFHTHAKSQPNVPQAHKLNCFAYPSFQICPQLWLRQVFQNLIVISYQKETHE